MIGSDPATHTAWPLSILLPVISTFIIVGTELFVIWIPPPQTEELPLIIAFFNNREELLM